MTSIKNATLALMKRAGVTSRIASSSWRRRRLLILCYHGIARFDEHRWNSGLYISSDAFNRRMELVHRHRCNVLPLGEAIERLRHNDLPDRAVSLTFDDGYYDFGTAAYPILRSFGYPATVYLTTLRCEHNKPIVGIMLSYLLWKHRNRTLDGRDLPGLGQSEYGLDTTAARDSVVARLTIAAAKQSYSKDDKDDLVANVANRLGADFRQLLADRIMMLLTPEEVRDLAKKGVDFQLHTHQHRSPNDAILLAREIRDNRERITAMTGHTPVHFCWPSGVYWPGQLATLAAEGVVSATTCDPGLAHPDSPPLLLPRFVDTGKIDETTFTSWLDGAAAWMTRRTAGQMASAAAM
jgi:peptidoglycan/xylan/chitin deacetylase (PgdA/CDA1 family)